MKLLLELRDEKFNWGSDQKQISYCYLGKIISKGTPHFTESELVEEFELLWMSLEEAIKTFENDKPTNFEGTFISKRDLTFLREAQKIRRPKM